MAKLVIYGGDFSKGDGWFYSGRSFVLRNKSGKPETIPLSSLEVTNQASRATVMAYGDDTALVADLQRVATGDPLTFIARFVDGRLLMASTDPKSYGEILAAPLRKTHSEGTRNKQWSRRLPTLSTSTWAAGCGCAA
jgi:hypothetical protein